MRNPETQTAPLASGPVSRPNGGARERSPADATSILLELTRALRGLSAPTGSATRPRALAERAFQAVAADIARAGPFELSIRGETFAVTALAERLDARGGLADLRRALVQHSIERLCFDAKLTADTLQGFLELLIRPPDADRDVRAFLRTLAARDSRGLRLNDLDVLADTLPRTLSATPPRPSLSVTTPLVVPTPPPEPEAPAAAVASPPSRPRLVEPASVPRPADTRGERLRARLVELDHTTDDAPYAQRAAEIVFWVRQVWQDGLREEAYRALEVFADHAVGCGGRAESQARIAAACFADLAVGERLEDLIDRALASDESGVRAAQLLLQRREAAVPLVVDRICALPDPLVATPLHALVLTSGEAAVPTLLQGISGPDDDRARVCLRLAGALQSPALLPVLSKTTRAASLGRQVEAIRALCLLPGEAAHQALAEALSSQLDQLAIAATQAIADNDGIDAVPALLDVLESHMRGSRTQLCRALIEVLGRLGDERAVPRLAAIVERKPVLRRAHWHAIQLAAVDALSVLPTREARRAVERAASHAAGPVRDRARARLSATTPGTIGSP
jgi:HEAT repeat protein